MTRVLDPLWGPYDGPRDAAAMLGRFVDKACGPEVGIAWAAQGCVYPLRSPRVGAGGLREVVTANWSALPPAPPKPPVGFWQKVWAGLQWCAEQEGKAAMQEAESNRLAAQGMDQILSRMLHAHRDDGLGVALDILAVGLSLALLPTGLGALGIMGLIGGSVLLAADGSAYAMELADDDETAELIKRKTERLRIVATLMTLPDVAWGGFKMIRELQEIQEMRVLDRATATAAERMGKTTSSADRAARFRQVAERAHLRAQLRTEQINALLKLEATGRGTGVGSTVLLVREELLSDESTAHQIARRLEVTCQAMGR